MKVALIGFGQSGKSTLLSAVSGKPAAMSGSNQIDEAVVPVPDARLDWLTGLYQPKKTVRALVDCLDFPGVSFLDDSARSASRRLLTQARTVDMFVLVIRAFQNDTVPPYRSSVDPRRDVAELMSELLLTDLEMVMTRIGKLQEQIQKGSKNAAQDKEELELQLKLQEALENERPASTVVQSEREQEIVRALGFCTLKPLMIVLNVGEGELDKDFGIPAMVDKSVPVMTLSAQIEQELSGLDAESREVFMADLGITESAVSRFVNATYQAMGFISFLTVGPDEVRAWPVRRGISALDAAGKIHSDIKRGFIRAETMSYADLQKYGDEKGVKAAGRARLEGKTYILEDGDIINFRFNV